jgi:anti-sigma factor RsiW
MCEYSGRLIAWMDGELPGGEAAEVEWHVSQCAECRRNVNAYAEVSQSFLACYETAMTAQPRRTTSRWALGSLAAAAVILVAILLAQPRAEHLAAIVPPPPHAPAMAFEKTLSPLARVRLRPRATHDHSLWSRLRNADFSRSSIPSRDQRERLTPVVQPWIAVEPSVEVALPADALFPPGAVPEGFSFIADVRP